MVNCQNKLTIYKCPQIFITQSTGKGKQKYDALNLQIKHLNVRKRTYYITFNFAIFDGECLKRNNIVLDSTSRQNFVDLFQQSWCLSLFFKQA